MSALDHDPGVREIAGKRARDEALVLDRLVESMRLASFRNYLAATVVSMSSLVPDVLALARSDVPGALQRLRPGHMWPAITGNEAQYGRTGPKANRLVKVGRTCAKRPAPLIGDAVIADGALGPWVEASVFGGSLDVTLRAEAFVLSTQDGTGYIRFTGTLPDSVIAACAGRPLRDVVDHPLLSPRNYVVEAAAQVGGGSSLTFEVDRLAVEMPWRD